MTRFQVYHPNHAILGGERHSQFGTHIGHSWNVSGILGYVVNQKRLTKLNGLPSHSFAYFDSRAFSELLRVSHLKAEAQFLSLLVEEKNGENFIVNDSADDFGDAARRGIQVERRRHDIGDLQQQRI